MHSTWIRSQGYKREMKESDETNDSYIDID